MWGALIVCAVLATWLALRWLAPRAQRYGLIDHPGGRKRHRNVTPTVGGLGIAFGLLLTLALFNGAQAAPFIVAGSLLIVVGALDDILDLHWGIRILAQVVASLLMVVWGGVRVQYLGDLGLPFSTAGVWFSVPMTVIATVGLINAVNMSDGSDGLAGMLCAGATFMLVCAALYAGNLAPLATLLPLLACIGVFLRYNVRRPGQPKARIFLGNAGSMFLGFAIAHEIFRLTQNPAHPVSPVLALWLFIPPVLDCLVLIVRRLKMRRSPFHADRGHMHHLLLDAGFGPSQVAAALVALQMGLGLLGSALLRLDAVTELHLLAGFLILGLGHYLLTARRGRAVRVYAAIARLVEEPQWPARAASMVSGERRRVVRVRSGSAGPSADSASSEQVK